MNFFFLIFFFLICSDLPFKTREVPSGIYLIKIFRRLNRINPYNGESSGSFSAASRISSAPLVPWHRSSTSSREVYLIQNLQSEHNTCQQKSCRRVPPKGIFPLQRMIDHYQARVEKDIYWNERKKKQLTYQLPGSAHAFANASVNSGVSNPLSDMMPLSLV